MEDELRHSGIDVIGNVPWGTHFCQFYKTKQDLIDILVPYFKAGLENNEFCMWVTAEPLMVAEAKEAMRSYVSEPQRMKLPSAPKKPIIVFNELEMPQPKLHRLYGGEVTLVGRLREDPVFKHGLAYVVTSDNLDKGAGGGAIQTAEYLKAKRYI